MSESYVPHILFSLALVLFATISFGKLFAYCRLPRVIGEILAGIILGKSLLGFFFPDIYDWLFDAFPTHKEALSVFYWIGLILLMFIAGFRVPSKLQFKDAKVAMLLIIGGVLPPMLCGYFGSQYLIGFMGNKATGITFATTVSVACAVTSIPVLASIFIDLKIADSNFAKIVLTAAVLQDLVLWGILSSAISISHRETSLVLDIFLNIICTFGLSILVITLLPKLLKYLTIKFSAASEPKLSWVLIICMLITGLSSFLKINIVFSALLAGLVIGSFSSKKMGETKHLISEFALWFFIPIYFGLTGMRINLIQDFDLSLTVAFLFLSSIIKIFGVLFLLKLAGFSFISSLDYGLTMNARGGPGIVLATIALEAELIDSKLFVALIVASIITSLLSGFWLRIRKDALRSQPA